MSEYAKLATAAGDQYLDALAETQENFLKSMEPVVEMMSKFPSTPAPAFAMDLPTPQELTEANFAFANKWLKQQKQFADRLFTMPAPASTSSTASNTTPKAKPKAQA